MSSSSGTTTSTVLIAPPTPTSTTLTLPIAPSARWQEPELSIGIQLPSLDRFGMYKCWSLKDKSPAALVWKNVLKPITKLIEDQFEHLDAKGLEFRIDMLMIGRKQSKAIPTVLFGCERKAPRQKAMDMVKKKGILNGYPGVEMASCARLPERLALREDSKLSPLPPGVYLNGELGGRGIAVLISRDGIAPPKKATIGGFVCIGDDCYGLTTAHAFEAGKELFDSSEEDSEFAFYGLVDHDDSSDEEDESLITSQGSVSSSSSDSPESVGLVGSVATLSISQDLENTGEHSGQNIAPIEQQSIQPVKIGSIFESAPPENPLDWALVKIDNLDRFISTDSTCRLVYPVSLHKAEGRRVLICLGTLETAVEGFLSDAPSLSKVPGGKIFQESWQVNRLDGRFVDGDCGSWIIDFHSGDLIGHINSGYQQTGIAYIISMSQIFIDIERCLSKPVRLATRSRMVSQEKSRLPLPNSASPIPSHTISIMSRVGLPEISSPPPLGVHSLQGPGGPTPPPPKTDPPGPGFKRPIKEPTGFINVTPRLPMDEEVCRRKLTSYDVYTIKKAVPQDPSKGKVTWALAEISRESLPSDSVATQVKKLNESRPVSDKKQYYQSYQQKQIKSVLDRLNAEEKDTNFEWSLAQLDSKIKSLKNGQRETTSIVAYVKRAPLKDVNAIGLYNALEMQREEKMAAMKMPPHTPNLQRKEGTGDILQSDVAKPPTINMGPRPRKPTNKKYHRDHDGSDSSSGFASDSSGSFSYSSSENTSMSSMSDRRQRSHSTHKNRRRSWSRVREHRRLHYIDDLIRSPEPRIRDSSEGGPIPTLEPGVPRGIPILPGYDPVAAAYQAGKLDADAERFGLDRVPRVRPVTVAADRSIASYGHPERRYAPVDPRYVNEINELRYRDAMEYISLRSTEPRGFSTNTNPFAPARRYEPSAASADSGYFSSQASGNQNERRTIPSTQMDPPSRDADQDSTSQQIRNPSE